MALAVGLLILVSPCAIYAGVYGWARVTHRLVHYSGGFIGRPNAMHGLGYTTWELAFLPATACEELVRGLLDPTW